MNVYPEEADDSWFYVADVCTLSEAIIGQLHDGDGFAVFDDMSVGMTMPQFWQLVTAEFERPCAPLPWERWVLKAREHMDSVGEAHPLWPVQHFLGNLGLRGPSERLLAADGQGVSDRLRSAVTENVRYLMRVGFVPTREHNLADITQTVFSRSDVEHF
jgi:hypothetical protein